MCRFHHRKRKRECQAWHSADSPHAPGGQNPRPGMHRSPRLKRGWERQQERRSAKYREQGLPEKPVPD